MLRSRYRWAIGAGLSIRTRAISVNKWNQLIWTLATKPGEEIKLSYRYTVLIRHD
jgi:hypothetical protein